jgi:hypothetical protein
MSVNTQGLGIEMKLFNLRWIIVSLIIILVGTWLYFANSVPNSASLESVQQVPKAGEMATEQQSGESTSLLNSEQTSLARPTRDPFKEFLSKKEKSQPDVVVNEKPSFPPGFDPFKAKLDEQKNEPHSAISPFSK